MPVFNGEQFIADSIKSILKQTYTNLELIIVNDASTDKTEQVIHTFKDKRIKYFRNNKRLGLAGNRNKALSVAKGEFLAVLDCDDISLPTRLEKQLTLFLKQESIVLCGTWTRLIDEHSKFVRNWKFPPHPLALKAQFYIQFPIVHSSAMFRSTAINKLKKKYDPTFAPAEDYDLCFRLLQYGESAMVPEYLTEYRIHSHNTSSTFSKTLTHTLPALYKREYRQLGLHIPIKQLKNFVLFLHPYQATESNIENSLNTAFQLHQAIRKTTNISWTTMTHWEVYIFKALLLQLKNYFLGFTNQKQPQP